MTQRAFSCPKPSSRPRYGGFEALWAEVPRLASWLLGSALGYVAGDLDITLDQARQAQFTAITMPALVVPTSALVKVIWAMGGTPYALNVFGALKVGAVVINQALADALFASVKSQAGTTALMAAIGTGVSLLSVAIRDISGPNLPEYVGAGAALPGQAAGNLLPPQIACCVTIRTALAGKSFRGRCYIPGFTVGSVTATGDMAANVGGLSTGFVNAIDSAMAANNLNLAVVSRKLLASEAATLVQSRNNQWETQRRRAVPGI